MTGFDDAFAELAAVTVPRIERYASRHGFAFECMRRGLGHPSWWKVVRLLRSYEYSRTVWMDADVLVTDFDAVPPGDEYSYHCSQDWGVDASHPWQVSNGCFSAGRTSARLMLWLLENYWNYSVEFHEQEHVRAAARGEFRDFVKVHPPRVFNAVPVDVHPSVREPWQPGDWCAHVTMVSLPERVSICRKILAQIEP